ncbi:MAG: DUF5056 domain-containing protein [Prevotella sp.]|nr:DUF5056 domain-containing protein [Prevotella sp.]
MDNQITNKNGAMMSDDELLAQFFNENRVELEDDGFAARVMQQLPSRTVRLSRIWTFVCALAGVAFFVWADGLGQLRHLAANSVGNVMGFLLSVDFSATSPLMLYAAISLLVLFAISNLDLSR